MRGAQEAREVREADRLAVARHERRRLDGRASMPSAAPQLAAALGILALGGVAGARQPDELGVRPTLRERLWRAISALRWNSVRSSPSSAEACSLGKASDEARVPPEGTASLISAAVK